MESINMLKEKVQPPRPVGCSPLRHLPVSLPVDPLAVLLFPIVSLTFAADEGFHRMLLWLVLPTSAAAFLLGCFRHKDRGVLALGSTGLIQLILAAHFGHDMLGEIGERIATSLGG